MSIPTIKHSNYEKMKIINYNKEWMNRQENFIYNRKSHVFYTSCLYQLTNTHVRTYTHTYVRTHACARAHTHTRMHTPTHLYTHTIIYSKPQSIQHRPWLKIWGRDVWHGPPSCTIRWHVSVTLIPPNLYSNEQVTYQTLQCNTHGTITI